MARFSLLLLFLLLIPDTPLLFAQTEIDLSGKWRFGDETIIFPGTTDTNFLGVACDNTTETTHLTRLFSYKGKARYEREVDIPRSWAGRPATLFLERTKPATVYVDGEEQSFSNNISTPQRHALAFRNGGKHTLTIVVDNEGGVPPQVMSGSHAYVDDTQTNWNGIIGKMALVLSSPEECMQPHAVADTLPCFRYFTADRHHFYANGRRVFLRGKHDACVWPLTGHVPMDVQSWMSYFGKCRDYGINHVRFHSWCPPEAAFVAADSLGIYLQPELPFWGNFDASDKVLMEFLHKEGVNILKEYGHHPSFVMMALGNELSGSIDEMRRFVNDFRAIAPDKLYTFGSNYNLGYKGIQPGIDYFTTCRIGGEKWGTFSTHTRGSFSFADTFDGGMINHYGLNTTLNFDHACDRATVPVISHETGQFQTYPDYDEMAKYKGVLYPYNMDVFRRKLEKANMGHLAKEFHKASGKWSLQLYKADIEMDLRTRNMAGFQLLDLQDYPGQGSAYVGILDAFMDSKGITTPNEWCQWCSDVVPLLVTDSFCLHVSDTLKADVLVADYSANGVKDNALIWTLAPERTQSQFFDIPAPTLSGTLPVQNFSESDLHYLGSLAIPMPLQPGHYRLTLRVGEGCNSYDVWTYPRDSEMEKPASGVMVVDAMNGYVGDMLERGATVLWMASDTISQFPQTIGPLFQTDYWNFRMFKTISENNHKPVSPGTMGLYIPNPQHPIFKYFPTDNHTSWQWFHAVKTSHPVVLDKLPYRYSPIVQVIDNVERNHKLGLIFELTVGKGRLLVCACERKQMLNHPETRALYAGLLRYAGSKAFAPSCHLSYSELERLLSAPVSAENLEKLDNISDYNNGQ